jgi:hypothetical protein
LAEPAQLPEAIRAQRLATIKQREDGVRAAAIKQGRILERQEIFQALGAKTVEDASQVAQLRSERDARPTLSEEMKHGRFRFWQGVAFGGVIFSVFTATVIFVMQGVIWDTAARSFREQAMTGALLSTQPQEP